MNKKVELLQNLLKSMESILVAYSGGVDSTFLLRIAKDTLGDNVLAVTAVSETYVQREFDQAKRIAKDLEVQHMCITTEELQYPNFTSNPTNRCYYCKKELFTKLKEIARQNHKRYVVDGTNADDIDDYRPGLLAIEELGIRSPLRETGLTKKDIRSLSRRVGLPTWNKPAIACLASRFPYGTTIDAQKLSMVERAEHILHGLGLSQVRVRHHDDIARIEIFPEEIPRFLEEKIRQHVVYLFKEIGYKYITLDLQGYRTGSMNEVIITDRVYA
jgi:uncharacterized protein